MAEPADHPQDGAIDRSALSSARRPERFENVLDHARETVPDLTTGVPGSLPENRGVEEHKREGESPARSGGASARGGGRFRALIGNVRGAAGRKVSGSRARIGALRENLRHRFRSG